MTVRTVIASTITRAAKKTHALSGTASAEPDRDAVPGQRRGDEETHEDDPHETQVEHTENRSRRSAADLADADLLAAVLGLEQHQPEDAHQRDEDRQRGERRDEHAGAEILAVEGIDRRIEELDVGFERRDGVQRPADVLHGRGEVRPGSDADIAIGERKRPPHGPRDEEREGILGPVAGVGAEAVGQEPRDLAPARNMACFRNAVAGAHVPPAAGRLVENIGSLLAQRIGVGEIPSLGGPDAQYAQEFGCHDEYPERDVAPVPVGARPAGEVLLGAEPLEGEGHLLDLGAGLQRSDQRVAPLEHP